MDYIVIKDFVDLMDDNHLYRAGEQYPRPGHVATDQRVAELAGSNNKVGRPLIKVSDIPIKAAETPIEAVQGEDKDLPAETPQAPKNANRARQKRVEE